MIWLVWLLACAPEDVECVPLYETRDVDDDGVVEWTVRHTYDRERRPLSVDLVDGGLRSLGTWAYDDEGRLVRETWVSPVDEGANAWTYTDTPDGLRIDHDDGEDGTIDDIRWERRDGDRLVWAATDADADGTIDSSETLEYTRGHETLRTMHDAADVVRWQIRTTWEGDLRTREVYTDLASTPAYEMVQEWTYERSHEVSHVIAWDGPTEGRNRRDTAWDGDDRIEERWDDGDDGTIDRFRRYRYVHDATTEVVREDDNDGDGDIDRTVVQRLDEDGAVVSSYDRDAEGVRSNVYTAEWWCPGEAAPDPVEPEPLDVTDAPRVQWDGGGVTITVPDDGSVYEFGMAETGVGAVGWYGEDCVSEDMTTWCHVLTAPDTVLESVDSISEVGPTTTLLHATHAPDITYLLRADDGSCVVWGDDPSYYTDVFGLDCAIISP